MESTTQMEKPANSFAEPAARSYRGTRSGARSAAPVFVLGCPRSGTTVLFHMLMSAGNFAIYRAESNVFSVLQPRFGSLRFESNRRELLRYWLKSKLFRVTGLEAEPIRERLLRECHSAGDFLRIVMEETARHQAVKRWTDSTPDHLLYIPQIKREIPNALIVHIIRDGRDVALSYAKQGWVYPLPWDRKEEVAVAGLFWEWIVGKGRAYGRKLGQDYYELRYEDLVEKPHETLRALGDFIGQDLDYDHILRVGIGSVSEPNSSFVSGPGGGFQPVQRWTKQMTGEQLENFEGLVGKSLQELGYPLSFSGKKSFRHTRFRHTYRAWFAVRHWLKSRTPLGRFSSIDRMGIEEDSAK